MTSTELAAYCRFITNTNSTTFTDAQILSLANIVIDDISESILDANEDYFGIPTTTSLILNQREYPFPDDILSQTKRVEVAFETTLPLTYIKLSELDLTTYHHGTDEATIVSHFSNAEGEAFYDIARKALRLFSGPIISVTDGLRLWSFQYPSHLTTLGGTADMSIDPSSTTFGFPRPFHELLARKVSILYKSSKEKPIPLNQREQGYEMDLQRKLNSIKHMSLDREIFASVPYNDGRQY